MAMADVLETELETFYKHKDSLLATDEGRYVLIHGDQVYGAFDTERDAIQVGYHQFGNVPILVKKIERVEKPITFGGGLLTFRV
jgi:hypothetical protein